MVDLFESVQEASAAHDLGRLVNEHLTPVYHHLSQQPTEQVLKVYGEVCWERGFVDFVRYLFDPERRITKAAAEMVLEERGYFKQL